MATILGPGRTDIVLWTVWGTNSEGGPSVSRRHTLIVPQQPYSSKAPPAVYIPEDSWPANQNCKLSHTLGGKNSYTTLSQPYTTLLWYKSVIPLPLRGLADTLLGLRPRSVYMR